MRIEQLYTDSLAIYSYLLWSEANQKCVVIDPTIQWKRFYQSALEKGVTITHIIETHVHADFLSGSLLLKSKIQSNPAIICSAMGGTEWMPKYADIPAFDHYKLEFPDFLLEALPTPGHTPEHMSWLLRTAQNAWQPTHLFSGDFLLPGSVGRPDLLGRDKADELAPQQFDSVFNRTFSLPDNLILLPAHGAGSVCGSAIAESHETTLGKERLTNRYFSKIDKKTWCDNLLRDQLPAAPYLSRIKHKNLTVNQAPQLPHHKEVNQLTELTDYYIIDIRSPEEYAKGSLSGSLHIPYTVQFLSWFTHVYENEGEYPLLLVYQNTLEAKKACELLELIGIEAMYSFKYRSDAALEKNKPFELMEPEELYKNNDDYLILDVRSKEEWQAGHIKNSMNIPYEEVKKSLAMLPKNQRIALFCGSGNRASIGASILQKKGFIICSIKGGMKAWKERKLPLEVSAK